VRARAALTTGFLLAGLAASGTARAAVPVAGTLFSNVARASYIDAATGHTIRVTSNTVTTILQPLVALLLTGSEAVDGEPADTLTFAHRLTNSGDITTTYTLSVGAAGGDFAATGITLVADTNGNGIADPGEPVLGTSAAVSLAPGATMSLVILAGVPATAAAEQSTQIRLTALAQPHGAALSETDTITVVAPHISVTKSAAAPSTTPGAGVTFALHAQNSGTGAARPVSVTVNGQAANLFILRDAIPANTTFASATTPTAGAQTLYHRFSDAPHAYVTALPAGTAVDGVAWGTPSLAATASLSGALGVVVNGNASGTVSNTGYADFDLGGTLSTLASNAVVLTLPPLAPSIAFYTDATYTKTTKDIGLGMPLYVQVNASQCNTDPTAILTHPLSVTSTLTGDTETFTATETGPNTGMYRVLPFIPTANGANHAVVSGDGILEVDANDKLSVTLVGCGVAALTTQILVDPQGTVFNSKTNLPVTAATVELIDVTGNGNGGHPGGKAVVFAADAVTPAPSTVTTGMDGTYSFPFVEPSTYRLQVLPPNGLSFPSRVPAASLPAGRNINAAASYGVNFPVLATSGPIIADIPVDSAAGSGLFLQKIASKSVAASGDFVDYTLTINNNTGTALPIVVDDELPLGFAFIAGSARENGVPLPNPSGGAGPTLVFGMGTLASTTQTVLTYRVRIGPAGASGTGTNTALASSGATHSNLAAATVKVSTNSALSDKAYVFGKVYADCNHNRIQDADEPGIPGVRLYLDTGTYVVTDIEGKYSIYGLTPRTHVAKVDVTSLPKGTTLEVLDNRNALDPGSQFVDLQSGELHKTDFAVGDCSPALDQELVARRLALHGARSEIAALAATPIAVNPTTVADPRTQGASGIIGQRNSVPGTADANTRTSPAPATDAPSATAPPAAAAAPSPPPPAPETLAQLLPTLTPRLDFLSPQGGSIIKSSQTRVRVKGAYGAQLRLIVNGSVVSLQKVGERSSLESVGVTAWEYVGVDLRPGDNLLELELMDDFGNIHDTRRLHVTAPGALARIVIGAPAQASADASQPLDIPIELRDEHGVPVFSRTELTLEATLGAWQTADLDPKEPGIQVFVEGGVGHFKLVAPANPGKGKLRVTSGALHAEAGITFMPNLRPLLAAGMVEGVLSLHNLSPSALVSAQNGDGFERQIENASRSVDGGDVTAAGRASLFLKGKVLGSDLLTLAYDSDKPTDTPLFRDIQPDQFYPVYGDSSVKGYDAQSTGKLYVRIDHGTSYTLYGDFSTQSDNPGRVLTQYSRALNGAKTHLEEGRLTLDGFVSDTSSTQVIDELPANGTSGPYQLSQHDLVVNSQQVDIITRDRNQPTLVLSDTPLTAFTDYAVDAFSAQILLKAPAPSLDANLNPVYVRVVYEVNGGAEKFWVGGIDARERIARNVTLDETFVRDTNPVTRASIGGGNFLWNPDRATSVVGEIAQTQSDLVGTGGAHRIELKHRDAHLEARVYAVQTDSTFDNPSSTYTAGAAEYGAKISEVFDARNRLIVDALKTSTTGNSIQSPLSIPIVGVSEAVPGGGSRQGESIALEHTLKKKLKLTTGVRHAQANGIATQALAVGAVPNDFTSARVRLDAPVPDVPKANVFAQYEQAIDAPGLKDTTVGGNYQVAPQTKFYVTHQSSNSLSGDYALNSAQQNDTTIVGLDTTYMQDGKMFDEYRVGDGVDGREARAAVGLRNLWSLAPGLGLSTSIQQVHPISGVVTDRATALTAALQYTANPDWKGSTRVEWSRSATSETWLTTLGAAVKINPSITALVRGVDNEQLGLGVGATSNVLRQGQLGVALRPVDGDVWNALAWVEHKRTDNGTLGTGLTNDEAANIFSTHVNYQADASWVITGRYGIKRATDYAAGLTTSYTAQVLGARSVWDLTEHWDMGLQYFVEFGGNGLSSRQRAIGGEGGYLVMKNLWLSIGYNVVGFKDADLASEDYTQRGVYLRLRFKFDENLFKPSHNTEPLPADAAVMK
jgi:uncharacterized repeat protein (TIGR01451 family)